MKQTLVYFVFKSALNLFSISSSEFSCFTLASNFSMILRPPFTALNSASSSLFFVNSIVKFQAKLMSKKNRLNLTLTFLINRETLINGETSKFMLAGRVEKSFTT